MARRRKSDAKADSPCINVCRIEETTGLCEGCARTIEEIVSWAHLTTDERAAVLADLPRRRAR